MPPLGRGADGIRPDATGRRGSARQADGVLSCAGSLSYNGTTCVAGGLSAAPIASKGNALLGAPWSFTGSAEYHFPEWSGRRPYLRLDVQHSTAQRSLLPQQDSQNALYDTTLPGLPVVNNLSARAGVRFDAFDVSLSAVILEESG